jgi:4'-phosphopantetheinyl transferase
MNEFDVVIRYAYCGNRVSIDQWNDLREAVPIDIKERIDKYRRWQDRQAVLFGRILLRNCLTEYGYPSECLEMLRVDEWGRLYLGQGIDFNISHSGGCVVCAASRGAKVGIDIEEIRELELEDFTENFSSEEWRYIVESEEVNRAFLDCWTIKESVLKAYGRGLSRPMKDVEINGNSTMLDGKEWVLEKIWINHRYSCHLSTDVRVSNIAIIEMILEQDLRQRELRSVS